MSTLYMIRHGQASFGKDNYDKLSEIGIQQSRILAEYFNRLDIRFDLLYTGSMVRHIETAHELISLYKDNGFPPPEVKQMEELNEYDSRAIMTTLIPVMMEEDPSISKDLEYLFDDQRSFQRIFEKVMLRWVSGDYNSSELTTWEEFVQRVYRGIEGIMKSNGRGKNIVIFTSGGAISVTVMKALRLSDDDTIRIAWQIVNSSVTRFKCTYDSIILSSFNEYAHLELNSKREMITYR